MTRILMLAAIAAVMTLAQPVKAASTLEISKKYIGMSERKHRKQLKAMMGFDPRGPWCGAWATFVVKKAGKRPPKDHNLARSWLRWGKPVQLASIKPDDVVVLGRKRGGHVGFFSRKAGTKICLVGGNQSSAVKETCYARSRVLGVRRG